MNTKKQLFVPIITPMLGGKFDALGYKNLVKYLDPFVD